jgi:hypothetical protein
VHSKQRKEKTVDMTKKDVKKIADALKNVLPKLPKEKQEYIIGLAEGMELARDLRLADIKEPIKERVS